MKRIAHIFIAFLCFLSLPAQEVADSVTTSVASTAPIDYNKLSGTQWLGLHQGFNAELSASVTAGFGKNAPKGVGLTESAAFTYVMPLGKRWIGAVGVYGTRTDWGGYHTTDVGIAGMIGYHAKDWLNLYVYGQKSLMPKSQRGMYPYLYSDPMGFHRAVGDAVGGIAEFKINEKSFISIGFEYRSGDNRPYPGYYGGGLGNSLFHSHGFYNPAGFASPY